MTLSSELLDILVCPQCRGDLRHRSEESALDCEACRLRYPIEDDIPVMLVDEAIPLGDEPASA